MSATHDVAFGNDVCLRHMKGKHRIIVSDSEQHHFCASRFIISRYSGGIIDYYDKLCYNHKKVIVSMKENKLADISTDFFVQIIVLVKDPKAKHGTKLTNRTLSSKRQRQAAFFQ